METLLIKKKEYEIVKEYDEHSLKVSLDGKFYYAMLLGYKTLAYSNFMYAYKRLYNANVSMPKRLVVDKKKGIVLLEFIGGPTVFDDLCEKDLDDAYYEQVFSMNWLAKRCGLQLDFDPHNFKLYENRLYYLSYTFDVYRRDLDFSSNQAKYWFYTKEFRQVLIDNHVDLDKSRIKTDFESNREMVLKIVQFYK